VYVQFSILYGVYVDGRYDVYGHQGKIYTVAIDLSMKHFSTPKKTDLIVDLEQTPRRWRLRVEKS
jgi:hypothetical protein